MGRRVDEDNAAFWARSAESQGRLLDSVVSQRPSDEAIRSRDADGWAEIWAGSGSKAGDDAWDTFLSGADDGLTDAPVADRPPRWRRPFVRSA